MRRKRWLAAGLVVAGVAVLLLPHPAAATQVNARKSARNLILFFIVVSSAIYVFFKIITLPYYHDETTM